MLLHLFLIGTFQVLTLFAQSNAGQPCFKPGSEHVYTWHETVNEGKCCEETVCHSGFEAVFCTEDYELSTCERCDRGKFNPDQAKTSLGYKCLPFRECSAEQVVHTEGTDIKDRVCKCDVRKGVYNADQRFNPEYCIHKSCEAGTELTESGECKPCPYGFYKPDDSSHSCIPWTECKEEDGLEIDYVRTRELSTVEDVHCKNITGNSGTGVQETSRGLPKTYAITTEKSTSTFIPGMLHVKETDGKSVYIAVAIAIAITILLALVGLMIWCVRRRKGKQEHDVELIDPPKVETNVVKVEKEGIEHDETSPLNASTENPKESREIISKNAGLSQSSKGYSNPKQPSPRILGGSQKVSRQPTECDDQVDSYPSQKNGAQTYTRQRTVDSGYDGNCSSENVSFHLSDSSDTVEEDLAASPSTQEPKSMSPPVVSRTCDKCGKLEQAEPTKNYFYISGANPSIQVGKGNHMVSNGDSSGISLHDQCSGCDQDLSVDGQQSGEHSIVEIERTGEEIQDEAAEGENTKLLVRANRPSQINIESTHRDEGFESFYRKTPISDSVAQQGI